MLISNILNNHILNLENKRLELLEKHKKTIVWYALIPIIMAIMAFLLIPIPPGFFLPLMAGLAISLGIYDYNIGSHFRKIKAKLKSSVLQDLMDTFHPDVEFSHTNSKQDVREIAKGTGFFRANRYHEEDVIQGKYNNVDFYFSEIHLSRKKKKSRVTVFDGLLFKIKIPDKFFPEARIQSRLGLLSTIFNEYEKNEEFGFYYDTDSPGLLDESLVNLFPFFEYLIKTNKDLRISTTGNEIVMFLKSDMKFMDDPKPNLKKSLLNNLYVENFAKQLNSLLYIVETLANNLNSQEIEERLQLKVLEYANKYEDYTGGQL